MAQIELAEGLAAGTPASGYGVFYIKTDGYAYYKDDGGTERLVAGNFGCRVYNSANISISDSTATALTFDTENYDYDAMHSTSSNTDRITANTAGVYSITGCVRFASNATGYRQVTIQLNGATNLALQIIDAVATQITYLEVTTHYRLAATDYVRLVVFQTSGGSLNVAADGVASPSFMAWRIGD